MRWYIFKNFNSVPPIYNYAYAYLSLSNRLHNSFDKDGEPAPLNNNNNKNNNNNNNNTNNDEQKTIPEEEKTNKKQQQDDDEFLPQDISSLKFNIFNVEGILKFLFSSFLYKCPKICKKSPKNKFLLVSITFDLWLGHTHL